MKTPQTNYSSNCILAETEDYRLERSHVNAHPSDIGTKAACQNDIKHFQQVHYVQSISSTIV